MIRLTFGLSVALFGTFAALSSGLAAPLACPEPLTVQESSDSPAADWEVRISDSPRFLAGVTFFDGDPQNKVSIAPTRDFRSKNDRVAEWSFGNDPTPIWLACRYLDTGVVLTQKLPASYRKCSVRYGAGGITKAIDCK